MDKKLKTILIDDEYLAREDLRGILSEFPNVEIIGEASSVLGAKKEIEKKPDLIFLDIQLRGETGFDLLPFLPVDIKVIFVTAFDQYAIRAFEVNALDYLLKPVDPKRLRQSFERINYSAPTAREVFNYDDSIFITLNNKYQFLKLNSIIAISAAGDYTEIHLLDNSKKLSTKLMKDWEDRLPENHFCRIHRSTIINLNFVEKIDEWFNQSFSVAMKFIEKPFVMSRGYASRLKKLF